MATEKSPLVAVHTLQNTTPEKSLHFVDDGRLIQDVAELGGTLVLSTRDTFDKGEYRIPHIEKDGNVQFSAASLGTDSLSALYARPTGSINRPGSESVPKLNANELKTLAGSKIELYEKVLSSYQVETHLVGFDDPLAMASIADTVHAVATDRVILKENGGFGGYSTKVMEKNDALSWISEQLETGKTPDHVLQPQIMFGRLPDGIAAVGTPDEKALVERARKDALLTELRMFVVKRGEDLDMVPILRVVPDKTLAMKGTNDDYIDVEMPDDLLAALRFSTADIMNRATAAAGDVEFALGAVDYYFDEQGLPAVMEANFRSPQLPITSENPIAGRALHKSIAKTLIAMSNQKEQ